jgi:fermentation-respiration switch protein FrsA (DUF1100 family)
MPWIIIGVLLIVLVPGVVIMLKKTLPISLKVYEDMMVKTSPDKWQRVCSAPENEEQVAMWEAGCRWADAHRANMQEVTIEHDGLHLYGEFYDFSSRKCVIVLPGRGECLKYSYYFAAPYEAAGMNVLVIDQRAHGKSDGKYNTVGEKEHGDLLAWIQFLEEQYGIQEVWFHGICIGAVSAILAASGKNCPQTVKGMVLEGPFVSFRETFKRHMQDLHRPVYPVCDEVMYQLKKYAGAHVNKTAPIRWINRVQIPVLFLFGKKDIFSVPKQSQKLIAQCSSPFKKTVWFEEGGHSHLRINNTEKYDQAIIEYVRGFEHE